MIVVAILVYAWTYPAKQGLKKSIPPRNPVIFMSRI